VTALEKGLVRAAVTLWWLYFKTGHLRREFLIAFMTAGGRVLVVTSGSFGEVWLTAMGL
jgi:hypothetical protein